MSGGFLSVVEGNNRAILVEVRRMADIDEKGERQLVGTERQTLLAQPDAQAARHAGASDVKAVQALNRNAHSGSAGGDQNESIELVAFKDEGGYDLLAAREMPEVKEKLPSKKNEPEVLTADFLRGKAQGGDIWARSFLPEIDKAERLPIGPIRDQELENVLKKAAVIFRPGDQGKAQPKPVEENQSQTSTGAIISRQAEKNPVLAPVKAHYDWTNKLEPGPERDAHRQLAREQLVQAEPQTKEELERLDRRRRLAEQEDCGVHEVPNGPKEALKGQVQYPEREIEGVRRLTPEDLQKLAKAFEAGPGAAQASIKETSDEILRRTGESTRDTVLAGVKLVVGLLEYDRDLLFNPEKARKQAAEAGEALGVLVVAGVSITAGGVGYADQIGKRGDYSLPLKHISEGINRWYDKQSPADQMAIVAEVSAGFGLSAGAVEANKLRKPGAFMEFLKEGLESLPRNPEAERKAIEAIRELFKGFANDRRLAVPGGAPVEKMPTHMLMSQSDDMASGTAKASKLLPGKDGALIKFENLKNLEVSNVIHHATDKHWTGANFVTGWKVESTLKAKFMAIGEALPNNFPAIDGWSVDKGIVTSIKSIELRAPTYQNMEKFEERVGGYVRELEAYDGTRGIIQNIDIRSERIKGKLLHLGIPDGALTNAQKNVIEKFARELESRGSDTKIKVTALR